MTKRDSAKHTAAESREAEKRKRLYAFALLHGAVFLYSLVTVCAKMASGKEPLSVAFIAWLCLEVLLLGGYALIWQQVLKEIELSVGYANKAVGLIWALLWSVLLFHDTVTPGKLAGIALVIGGTVLMNTGGPHDRTQTDKAGGDG